MEKCVRSLDNLLTKAWKTISMFYCYQCSAEVRDWPFNSLLGTPGLYSVVICEKEDKKFAIFVAFDK